MSADNIVNCPCCRKIAGDVEHETNTLREWVDVGLGSDGIFLVDYRCVCSVCDFEWKYHKTIKVKIQGD